MKTFLKLTVLMSTLVLLSLVPAMAQIENGLTFDAPFAFYAGNARLPAGSYRVTQPADNDALLLIESANGSHSVLVDYVPAESTTPASRTEITFNKYGATDFLSGISLQGENMGMQFVPSKAEQNAAAAAGAEKHAVSARRGR